MSVRRHSDYRTARGPEGRPRPSIREERVSSLPPTRPEERRGHRATRTERNREDDLCRPAEWRSRPEPGSLSTQESLLGGSLGLLRRNRAPRLPREDREQTAHDGHQTAIRGQVEQSLLGPRARPPDQDRPSRSVARALRVPRAGLVP